MKMKMASIFHAIKAGIYLFGVFLTNMYCIPTYLVWMWLVFGPIRLIHPPLYWYIEGILFKWLLGVVSAWSFNSNYRVVEVGEDMTSCYNERCLVVANHQSTSDVPFLMVSFQVKDDITPSLLWIMDRLFRYTNFGTVSMTHGDFFITQGKDVRDKQIRKLENHFSTVYLERNRKWIVLFPEGGFLSKRLETSQRYAEKNGFPILKHVTLPRVGAMYSLINTLSKENLRKLAHKIESENLEPLKWLIDVTIGYEKGNALSLPIICSAWRAPCKVYLHFRRFPIEKIPRGSINDVQDWLYDRWVEKEEMLDEFYSTGSFPSKPRSQRESSNGSLPNGAPLLSQPREVTFSLYWIGFLHFFFIASTVVHTFILTRLAIHLVDTYWV